jgi:hypothetical protein
MEREMPRDWLKVNYCTGRMPIWLKTAVGNAEDNAGPYQLPVVMLRDWPGEAGKYVVMSRKAFEDHFGGSGS